MARNVVWLQEMAANFCRKSQEDLFLEGLTRGIPPGTLISLQGFAEELL